MILVIKEDIGDYSFPGDKIVALFDIGSKTVNQILTEHNTFVDNLVEKEYATRSKNIRVKQGLVRLMYDTWPLLKFIKEKLKLAELTFGEHFI